jgi:hypothetical protein
VISEETGISAKENSMLIKKIIPSRWLMCWSMTDRRNELDISQCLSSGWKTSSCTSGGDVGIYCRMFMPILSKT